MNDVDNHVGDLISGYLDGELTQQERQLVQLHVERCDQCKGALDDLRALQKRVGDAKLKTIGEDNRRETMDDVAVRSAKGLGWLLLITGALLGVGYGVFEFMTDPEVGMLEKVAAGVIYLGLGGLFFSVLRQRLIERKSDKYTDVGI